MKAITKGYSGISTSASIKQMYGFYTANNPSQTSLGI